MNRSSPTPFMLVDDIHDSSHLHDVHSISPSHNMMDFE